MSLLLRLRGVGGALFEGAIAEAGDSLAAGADVEVGATLGIAEAGDTLSAAGDVQTNAVAGNLAATESDDGAAATAAVAVSASGAASEAGDGLAAVGNNGEVIEAVGGGSSRLWALPKRGFKKTVEAEAEIVEDGDGCVAVATATESNVVALRRATQKRNRQILMTMAA